MTLDSLDKRRSGDCGSGFGRKKCRIQSRLKPHSGRSHNCCSCDWDLSLMDVDYLVGVQDVFGVQGSL